MSELNLDNPAARLWHFMKYLREERSLDDALRCAISDYFNLDNAEPGSAYDPRMFRCIAELVDLPRQITEAVESRPVRTPPDELVLRPLVRVEQALRYLGTMGAQQVRVIRDQYTDADVNELEHCIWHISSSTSGRQVDADTLSTIRDLAQEVMDLANETEDLTDDARQFVWDHAFKIWQSTEMVKAAGSGALSRSVDETVGHLLRAHDIQTSVAGSGTAGKRFFELLSKVSIVVNLIHAPLALSADAASLMQLEQQSPTVQAPGQDQTEGYQHG